MLAVALVGLGAIGDLVQESPRAGAIDVARDGLTAETAAPSCWSIKQSFPSSPSGIYWLVTPRLVEPAPFYCDQTTEGGGWVLVGRGREGWSFQYWGQGSPSTVRTAITGPEAFVPATLPTQTIDGLMNGGRMDALTDGIRLRRATNTTGTTWQEVRMRVRSFGSWSWAFGGGIRLNSIRFDNTNTNLATSNYRTNTTANVQVANDTRRVTTYPQPIHNDRAGFSFGAGVTTGLNDPASYLWEFADEQAAIPFTQVFIRPMVDEDDVVAAGVTFAPDAGLPASTVRPMLDRRPTPLPWGVTGLDPGDAIPGLGAYVTAFADIGNTIYVGGKFLQVQNGPGGAATNRPYLAAFNKTTGAWIPGFAPTLDGPVWELKAAPDGSKLFVAGEFSSVNGVANTRGLAALSPTNGAPVANWVGYVNHTTAGVVPDVRTLDIQSGFLYIGGLFNRVSGGIGGQVVNNVIVGRLARLRLTDGRPDGAWKPNVETAPQDIDASAQGDRVYVTGLFETLNGVALPEPKLAVIDATTAGPVPNLQPWQPNADSTEWDNAILEVGSKVYLGGTQHLLHQYARSNFAFERSHLTKNGGDFQAIAYRDGVLYASCHCTDWQFEDSNTWSDPSGYTRVSPMNLIGAYDTTDNLEVIPEFHPTQIDLTGTGGEGPWELFVDSDNCMWAGGDLMRLGTTPTPFYGGFERFCGRDATAPTVPGNVHATLSGNDVTLTWNAATDNATAPIRYEVLKDDPELGTMVMGTTFERSFVDTNVFDRARYFVRTVDDEGNRSPTTAAMVVNPPPPPAATLMNAGATWSYRSDAVDQGTAWRLPSFNRSSWPTGPAQLGWGGKGENTVIPVPPVTSYFIRHQTISNPGQYETVTIRLKRDDGAVVYVNGIPAVRDNMPAGPVNASTLASSFTSNTAETTWFDHHVPADLFVNGDNTIAVELHQAQANNADGIFDLSLIARHDRESTPPSTPAPKVDSVSSSTIGLSWPAATDNASVIGYLVRRDGARVGFTATPDFVDTGLAVNTSYNYQVNAIDSSGNSSGTGSVAGRTTPDEPDTTPPVTTDNTAGIGSAWKRTAQTVTLTPVDDGWGPRTTYFTTNGSTPTTASPEGTSIGLATTGTYTVKYFTVDWAGNVEPVRTAGTQIRIDTVNPTQATTFPGNGGNYNSTKWNAGCPTAGTLCGTAADSGSGVASVRTTIRRSNNNQYWTGTAWQAAAATVTATGSTSWSVPLPTTKLASGVTYTVTSWSVDRAGNTSPTTVRHFTYDTKRPTTTPADIVPANRSGTVNASIDRFGVTFNEAIRPTTVPATATLTLSRSNGLTSYAITGLTSGLLSTGGSGYLGSSAATRTVTFRGTLTLSNGNRTVTFTVTGACAGACSARISTKIPGAFKFKPASSLRDLAGNPPATTTHTAAAQVMF
jgi:hypothetical protein